MLGSLDTITFTHKENGKTYSASVLAGSEYDEHEIMQTLKDKAKSERKKKLNS